MSHLVAGWDAPPPLQQGAIPPVALQSSPLARMYGTAPPVMPQGVPLVMPPKDKQQLSGYMLSGSMASVTLSRVIPISSLPVGSSPGAHRVSSTTKTCIALPETLLSAIQALCKSSI
jgi:hypothetical protein